MIKNYFKIAWRNLTRHKVNTAINILGLTLGITACLIIYLITSFEFSYDTFHPDKERIYRIVVSMQNSEGTKNEMASLVSVLPMTMRNEVSGFEDVSAFYNLSAKVTIPDGSKTPKKFDAAKFGEETSPIIIAEPQYFDIFKYQWLAGNAATALNEPLKVVLAQSEAYKYFGTNDVNNIIGREVIYNDSLHVTVSGVVKDWNKNTDFGFKDFISVNTIDHSFLKDDIDLHSWGMWDFESQGIVKLAKGVTPAQVERQFPKFVKDHVNLRGGGTAKLSLQPLSDIHFNDNYRDAYSPQAHLPTLFGLMGITAFILIIATINFINLSTAQSVQRAKEIGVRKVLGSSRANIVFQFLTETFILTSITIMIAAMITNPVIGAFHSFIPNGVALNLYQPQTLFFLLLILIVTSLLAGFYPARVLSSFLPVLSLKGQASQKLNQKSFLRKSLIVFQFTVSLVFIIATIVIGNQIHYILNKDLGFKKDAIVTFHPANDNPTGSNSVFKEKLQQIPGVQIASRHIETPVAKGHPGTYITTKGNGKNIKIDASFDIGDVNYVPLFGLQILAGRNVFPSDTVKEFLVNETCAKALGFLKPGDAIGKMVETGIGETTGPIVGVIKDFHSASLHEAILPFFITSKKDAGRSVSAKLSTRGSDVNSFKNTMAQIEKAWKDVYPNEKFEYSFFDETIARLYEREQKTSQLMNVAMAIAIFISCMGLFGLATFTAQQRTKEIGIRKVLGASVPGIITMLSKDFLKLVLLSIIIASPIAYYFMHQWLNDFAYRVNISWWVFVLAGMSAFIIAIATVSFQAIKAAVANPVESLRTE
jgi:putative ABC transport system permease protein